MYFAIEESMTDFFLQVLKQRKFWLVAGRFVRLKPEKNQSFAAKTRDQNFLILSGLSAQFPKKGGKLHFPAPIGALIKN